MSLYQRTSNKRKVTLLSYPRTGSNWLSYCIERISGFNVIGSDAHIGDISVERRLESDPKALVHKTHGGKLVCDLFMNNTNKEGLLLNIRNYKECILRDAPNKPKYPKVHPITDISPKLKGLKNQDNSPDYLAMLELYDKYDGPKILIDYDDLILEPKKELKKLFVWLSQFGGNDDEEFLNKFMEDIDSHKKNSMSLYKRTHGTTATDGDPKKLKIQKETWLNNETENEIDEYVEKISPLLYEKYLKRYKL